MVVLFNIFDIFSLSILYYVIYPNDQLLYTFFVLFTYLTENNRNVKFKKCEMNVDSLRVSVIRFQGRNIQGKIYYSDNSTKNNAWH